MVKATRRGAYPGIFTAALALGLFWAAPGRAQAPVPEKPTPPAGDEASASGAGQQVLIPVEAEASLGFLTDELLQAFGRVGHRVQKSSLYLDDLMLAVACSQRSVACLQKIGRTVRATALLLASAKKEGGEITLSLRWLDVGSGVDRGSATVLLPLEKGARATALDRAVRKLLGKAEPSQKPAGGPAARPEPPPLAMPPTGTLELSSLLPFVEVTIDGQPRGALPLRLDAVPPGHYAIVARRPGYRTWRSTVEVKVGRTVRVEIDLDKEGGRVVASSGFFESLRPHTWLTLGAGLSCFAIGAGFAAHLRSQQNAFDQTRGVTPAELTALRHYQDVGQRDATVANVMFGVGGGLVGVSVILAVVDYLTARRALHRLERERQ
ncbi:MAG: PEGA domain-containing protein, partial [Deltaproteobacteria bacterium]|nr:PEGA domain-containing protein [Deltaproteobacteria bacterium]